MQRIKQAIRRFGRTANLNDKLSMNSERRMLESLDDRHVRIFKISVFSDEHDCDGIEQSLLTVVTRMNWSRVP